MTPPTAAPPTQPDDPGERTFLTGRVVAATPAAVYAAFVSAERLARWWGPKGFRNTFEVFEPREGGSWRFVMHGPEGGNYRNASVFEALVPGERIVIHHVCDPRYTLTVTLAAEGAGTRVGWRQVFESDRDFQSVRRFVPEKNEENLDRLEAELARGA